MYQTFINMMNQHIRDLSDISNPFKFDHIKSIQQGEFTESGPCVVMASPGFLQNGVSRAIFENWCENERNAVIIAGNVLFAEMIIT